MRTPLVTILTPCYNGETYLPRFFDGILNQTYAPLQLILVNDGSTDRTETVVKEFKAKLEQKGIKLVYLRQENQGQSAAVNLGLKKITGEYLTWPDSDDILPPTSIEEKVDFLENHAEYGFVRTDALFFDENKLTKPMRTLDRHSPKRKDEDIFDRLLFEQNLYSMSGTYMVRTNVLDAVIRDREIFCSRGGQNWQLQLPITYAYKGGYIDKPLYYCVVRKNSHSRQIKSNEMAEQWQRYDTLKEIIHETLRRIDGFDHAKYAALVEQKYDRYKFIWTVNHKRFDECETYYQKLKNAKALRVSDRLKHLLKRNGLCCKMITAINKGFFYFGIYHF